MYWIGWVVLPGGDHEGLWNFDFEEPHLVYWDKTKAKERAAALLLGPKGYDLAEIVEVKMVL